MKSKFDKIKKIVHETSIHISTNLRKEDKDRFVEYSKEHNRDYAVTLRWLLDFKDGILSNPNQQLSDRIDFLSDEIEKIKQSLGKESKQPEKEVIRMISGRTLEK